MEQFTVQSNEYLNQDVQAFYHQDYTTFGTDGNPDFLNYLKNQFDITNGQTLNNSMEQLKIVLNEDLPQIQKLLDLDDLIVCVIPRAKREDYYSQNQKLFRRVVSDVVDKIVGLSNGVKFIMRHTNTKTTHLEKSGYGGIGDLPYVGITKKTCDISKDIKDKNILLIDDIYTSGVNIDEDAIQALYDNGAKNVFFYAVGKTFKG
tara:strand:- start:47 stop:658 length:612 start_codon:yes stop_codon:yes gene_type:complete